MSAIQKMIPLAGSGLSHQVQWYMQMCTERGRLSKETRNQNICVWETPLFQNNTFSDKVQYWICVDAERHFKMWISAELNYSFCSRAWATWWMFIHSSLTLKNHSAACWIRYKLHIILFSVDTLWIRQQIWKSYCMLWNQVKKILRVFARALQIADSHLYDILLPILLFCLGPSCNVTVIFLPVLSFVRQTV